MANLVIVVTRIVVNLFNMVKLLILFNFVILANLIILLSLVNVIIRDFIARLTRYG